MRSQIGPNGEMGCVSSYCVPKYVIRYVHTLRILRMPPRALWDVMHSLVISGSQELNTRSPDPQIPDPGIPDPEIRIPRSRGPDLGMQIGHFRANYAL